MKRVLICGAGFAGLAAAKYIRKHKNNLELIVIDENQHHEYIPSIPEIISGQTTRNKISIDLEKKSKKNNFEFRKESLKKVDLKNKKIRTNKGEIKYDYLIVSIGSETNFFGQKIQDKVFEIKNVEDAEKIRDHITNLFKKADETEDKEKIENLLRFVVVGGGLTGVETVCEIYDLAIELCGDYGIDEDLFECILIESGDRVLKTYPKKVGEFTTKFLEKKGITVITGNRTSDIQKDNLSVGSKKIKTNTIIWCTGVKPKSLMKDAGLPVDKKGGLAVDKYFQLKDHPEVFGIGDNVFYQDENEFHVVWNAQNALNQGKLLASNLCAIERGEKPKPFKRKELPTLISLGKGRAIFTYRNIFKEGWPMAKMKKLVEKEHMLKYA